MTINLKIKIKIRAKLKGRFEGIGTLDRKMTSFRQSVNILRFRVRVRVRAGVSVNTFSIKRVFDQM